MSRGLWGALIGILVVAIWNWFGFGGFITILVAGVIGYTIAVLTGSSEDSKKFKIQVNSLLTRLFKTK